MLPLLYQTHLESKLEQSEFLFFNILINILQDIKEVSLEKIATALPVPILFKSRRKKILHIFVITDRKYKNALVPNN